MTDPHAIRTTLSILSDKALRSRELVQHVKWAPKACAALIRELDALREKLNELKTLAESISDSSTLAQIHAPAEECTHALDAIQAMFKGSSLGLKRRVTWKVKHEVKVVEMRVRIRICKEMFMALLHPDTGSSSPQLTTPVQRDAAAKRIQDRALLGKGISPVLRLRADDDSGVFSMSDLARHVSEPHAKVRRVHSSYIRSKDDDADSDDTHLNSSFTSDLGASLDPDTSRYSAFAFQSSYLDEPPSSSRLRTVSAASAPPGYIFHDDAPDDGKSLDVVAEDVEGEATTPVRPVPGDDDEPATPCETRPRIIHRPGSSFGSAFSTPDAIFDNPSDREDGASVASSRTTVSSTKECQQQQQAPQAVEPITPALPEELCTTYRNIISKFESEDKVKLEDVLVTQTPTFDPDPSSPVLPAELCTAYRAMVSQLGIEEEKVETEGVVLTIPASPALLGAGLPSDDQLEQVNIQIVPPSPMPVTREVAPESPSGPQEETPVVQEEPPVSAIVDPVVSEPVADAPIIPLIIIEEMSDIPVQEALVTSHEEPITDLHEEIPPVAVEEVATEEPVLKEVFVEAPAFEQAAVVGAAVEETAEERVDVEEVLPEAPPANEGAEEVLAGSAIEEAAIETLIVEEVEETVVPAETTIDATPSEPEEKEDMMTDALALSDEEPTSSVVLVERGITEENAVEEVKERHIAEEVEEKILVEEAAEERVVEVEEGKVAEEIVGETVIPAEGAPSESEDHAPPGTPISLQEELSASTVLSESWIVVAEEPAATSAADDIIEDPTANAIAEAPVVDSELVDPPAPEPNTGSQNVVEPVAPTEDVTETSTITSHDELTTVQTADSDSDSQGTASPMLSDSDTAADLTTSCVTTPPTSPELLGSPSAKPRVSFSDAASDDTITIPIFRPPVRRISLHAAVMSNSLSTVRTQLETFGDDLNSRWHGKTPLQLALEMQAKDITAYLFSRGALLSLNDLQYHTVRDFKWAHDEVWYRPIRAVLDRAPPRLDRTREEVLSVVTMLKKGLRLPLHVVRQVLDLAEYWMVSTVSKEEKHKTTYFTPEIAYLASGPIVGRVRKVVFKTTSADQGWAGTKLFDSLYEGSHTWFEAGFGSLSALSPAKTRLPVQKNVRASTHYRTHINVWSSTFGDDEKVRWLGNIQPGDRITLYPKVGFKGWGNNVKRAEMIIYTACF